MRRAGAAALLVLLAARAHAAPPASPYAPSPAGFTSLTGSREEEDLATRAVAAIDAASPEEARRARDDLLSAGAPGTRAAAAALAAAEPSPDAEVRLLEVLAASARPEVDAVLARAATRPRFEVRALAAQALGAGRTAGAVETLSALARDAVPAVRGAAVRGLFAIESPAAEAARLAIPAADPAQTALRLRLHRLRGDERPALAALALDTWARSPDPAARAEAARCLALPALSASSAVLAWVVLEAGGAVPAPALATRFGRGWGVEPGVGRLAAAEALATLLPRADVSPAARAAWLRLAASWIARPLRAGGTRIDGLARDRLLEVLPDAGAPLVEPVTRLLLAEAFADPQDGTALLGDLEESVALPALRAIVDPRAKSPEEVAIAAAATLRTLGRLGDAEIAAALLDPSRPVEIRSDAVRALRRDPPGIALPLLASVASDSNPTVASEAAKVLLARPEPAARAAVEAALLDARWQRHEHDTLVALVAKATDADWDFLDRAIAAGPAGLRDSIFDAMRSPRSHLRGPRAVALVHASLELIRTAPRDVPLGIDEGSIARALCAVAPAEGVAFVRAHWRGPDPRSHVFLRDLQTVRLAEAGEFALEVAATVPDSDAVTLGIVTTVLGGECEKDPERLDPFWRRCLGAKSEAVVKAALSALEDTADRPRTPAGRAAPPRPRFARKPLEPLLTAVLGGPPAGAVPSDGGMGGRTGGGPPPPPAPAGDAPARPPEGFSPETRISALKALLLEPAPGAEPLLARIAFDGTEDDSLREEAANALVVRATPATREAALVWLEAPSADASSAVSGIARTAGRGASPAGAARLLALLSAALEKKFAAPPYFRPGALADSTDDRIDAACEGIGETGDAATLDAVAALLFDPRFARWSLEALRAQWVGFPASPGPLSPLVDPAPFPTQLRRGKSPTAEAALPVPAAPPALQALRAALCAQGAEAAATRISRAIAEARGAGRLARFPDAYLTALARQLRADDRADFSAAAEAVEAALPYTFPSATAEEVAALVVPVDAHLRARRFDAAARAFGAAAALAARTGLCDVEPSADEREEESRLASWRRLRAGRDACEGAAAAAAGKPEEARDAFARALARSPDADTLRLVADLRSVVKFDLAAAEADARRGLSLVVRRGEDPRRVAPFLRTLAYVLRLAGKPEAARRVLEGVTAEESGD